MSKSKVALGRENRLLPRGVPRWVRCYDNGGIDGGGSIDRYTVVFTGRLAPIRAPGCPAEYPYLAMNAAPFHPQGFGQHGSTKGKPCDVNRWGFAPAVGRKNHLGRRILFASLPADCRELVLRDYRSIWSLEKYPTRDRSKYSTDKNMSSTNEADFTLDNQGSIFLFRPLTEAARLHLEQHCRDATWFGGALCCEHRYAGNLTAALRRDGFKIE